MWLGFVSVCGERTGPWSLNEVLKGDSVTIEPGGSLAAVLRKSASADGFPTWTLTMLDLHTKVDKEVLLTEQASRSHLAGPAAVAFSPNGKHVAILDSASHSIKVLDVQTKDVKALAGSSEGTIDGVGTVAKFKMPQALAWDPLGTFLAVADTLNHRVRSVSFPDGAVSTLAGSTGGFSDGTGTEAQFNNPSGVAISPDGRKVMLTPAGPCSPSQPRFLFSLLALSLAHVCKADACNTCSQVLVADEFNDRIRAIDLQNFVVKTVAGTKPVGRYLCAYSRIEYASKAVRLFSKNIV